MSQHSPQEACARNFPPPTFSSYMQCCTRERCNPILCRPCSATIRIVFTAASAIARSHFLSVQFLFFPTILSRSFFHPFHSPFSTDILSMSSLSHSHDVWRPPFVLGTSLSIPTLVLPHSAGPVWPLCHFPLPAGLIRSWSKLAAQPTNAWMAAPRAWCHHVTCVGLTATFCEGELCLYERRVR